jgi:hypothetical protein
MTLTRYQSLVLTTDVDGAEQVSPRDTRFNLAGATPLFKIHGAGAGPIGNESFGRWVLQQNVDRESDPTEQFVIHPGHETRFYLGTANTPLRLTLIGYAYPTVGRALGKL